MPTYLVETIMRPGVLYEVGESEYQRLVAGNWLVGDPDRITPEVLDQELAAVVEDPQSETRAAVQAIVSVGGVPDADADSKGIIQLAGDLGGTASAPAVPALAGRLSDEALRATFVPVFGITAEQINAASSASDAIQAVIDTAAAAGGGVVQLPAGQFILDVKPLDGNRMGLSLWLPSNVTLRGAGRDITTLKLDPAGTPIVNGDRYWVIRVGKSDTAASNVTVEALTVDGSQAALTGQTTALPLGGVFGIQARHDGANLALHADHVTVQDCRVTDCVIPIGCTKDGNAGTAQGATRLDQQFRNWIVRRNLVDTCTNKAIELAECNGGSISDNVCTAVEDGPQTIFSTRRVVIARNRVEYLSSGINVSQGSQDIKVIDNDVRASAAAPTFVGRGALSFRAEDQAVTSSIARVVVRGNTFVDTVKDDSRVLAVQSRGNTTAMTVEGVTFDDNYFQGNVELRDILVPTPAAPRVTVRRIAWGKGNTVTGDILTDTAVTDYEQVGHTGYIVPRLVDAGVALTAWPNLNQARFARFDVIDDFATVRYLLLQVGAQAGNIQVGIVRMTGELTYERVLDTGVIPCPASGEQALDLGAQHPLPPGPYAFFFWADNTTVQIPLRTSTPMQALKQWGVGAATTTGVPATGAIAAWSNRIFAITGSATPY